MHLCPRALAGRDWTCKQSGIEFILITNRCIEGGASHAQTEPPVLERAAPEWGTRPYGSDDFASSRFGRRSSGAGSARDQLSSEG